MMNLKEIFEHYTDDLADGTDIRKEAIASIEQAANHIDGYKLRHNARLFAIAYLALTDESTATVVRCKGCKHSTLPSELTQRYGVPGTLTCHNRYSPCNRRNVGGEDFCSYGERRDGSGSDVYD